MAGEKEKPEEKSTEDAPKVNDKEYGIFKGLMDKYLSEKEEADKNKPHRTPESEPETTPSVLHRLFGG